MIRLRHLQVEEFKLTPGQEWQDVSARWRFLRVHHGAAYWLGAGQNRPLAEREVIIVPPAAQGSLLASQLGEVTLHGFAFAADLLYGFFTLAERIALEAAGDKIGVARCLPSTHPVAQSFTALATEAKKSHPLSQRLVALSLVAAVFEEELNHPAPIVATLGTSALHRFKELIVRMPDTELMHHSPEGLARFCGCSPRHFTRLFRQHFGVSPRDRQTELRLLKARQLLTDTGEKVVFVALESGYRNLSLFNVLFKRRFGMTPSAWRRKAGKNLARAAATMVAASLFFVGRNSSAQVFRNYSPLYDQPAVPEKAPAAKPEGPTFEVKGYELDGNTLLPPVAYEPILNDHIGPAVSFVTIRECLANLTIAYRVRGFSTVALSLPQQQLTNGIVTVKVTEGRLVDVKVSGNRFFSTRNVLRTLPSLRTNAVLNSILLNAELDRANGNRDRQIYPVVAPGPEPGTSVLEVRVKDQLPLHGRFELNNHNTPGSPELRMNLSASYDNLWQLEHQIGVAYSLTPQELKKDQYDYFVDAPLIANYSAFYRFPLGPVNGAPSEEGAPQTFGYDEATRKFNLPANSGRTELNVYASRSSSDSGKNLAQATLTPATIPSSGGLQVSDQLYSRSLSINENLGFRLSQPLPEFWKIRASLSAGLDYKAYQASSYQDRIFSATIYVPQFGDSGPPFDEFSSPPTASSRNTRSPWLNYVPLAVNFSAARPDENGTTSFNVNQSYELSDKLGRYYIVSSGFTREQKIEGDWGIRFHADGQWADQQLFNNEQFGLGGEAGVRGYQEGETYGDSGWRATIEPHTPQFELGLVDDTEPMLARLYTFFDYGERYNYSSFVFRTSPPQLGNEPKSVSLAGTGAGISATIGDNLDMRLQVAFALRNYSYGSEPVHAGDMRISFSAGAQF